VSLIDLAGFIEAWIADIACSSEVALIGYTVTGDIAWLCGVGVYLDEVWKVIDIVVLYEALGLGTKGC
jgi:hypothetical protein